VLGQQGDVDHQPCLCGAVDVQQPKHFIAADNEVIARLGEGCTEVAVLRAELHAQE
jgi:hypothetical protein